RLRAGTSLRQALELAVTTQRAARHPRAVAAAQDIVYTATRHLALIDALIAQLAAKPPAAPVAALLAVALAQLVEARPRHATYTVVDQAVTAARADRRTAGAAGFINATLRTFLRSRDELIARASDDEAIALNAPRWWIERLQHEYPQQWRDVLAAHAEQP